MVIWNTVPSNGTFLMTRSDRHLSTDASHFRLRWTRFQLQNGATVFQNTYFTFSSHFKKRDLTVFLNEVSKSRKKSLASLVLNRSKWVHILRSVITVIHFSYFFVGLVHLRTYGHLSHTVLSCIVSCECEHYVRISEQRCLMLVTYRYWFSVIFY